VWGLNFPREYGTYRQMLDSSTRTRYGGSYPRDYLEETPANVILFSGYAFAKQYQQARGHVYAVQDVKATIRTGPASPATCFTCKSPDAPRLMQEMGGAAKFYAAGFSDLKDQITHAIGLL
jgi:nitrite reductase (cytochrome c-552)